MINLFSTPAERQKKKNENLLARASKILDNRKAEFRVNAVRKLIFLYPDLALAASAHSDQFAGYSKERDQYIFGCFFDRFLPDQLDLLDLRDLVGEVDFEDRVGEFVRKVRDFTKPKDVVIDGESRSYNQSQFDYMIRTHGESGYTLGDDQYIAYEARLSKNGKIFARSSVFSPKPLGYFSELSYKNIVQDIYGTGVSTVRLDIYSTNYGECDSSSIYFSYMDPPRRNPAQSRDHLIKVCSQFMPFLQAIEKNITSPQVRDEIFGPNEEDLNDRAIGL